jgi:protein-S-isoprenylcysteine O-methyltransferase Ste14
LAKLRAAVDNAGVPEIQIDIAAHGGTNASGENDCASLRTRVQMKLNIATTLVLILTAAVVCAVFATRLEWTPWRIAGVAIVAPSLLFLVAARLQLGRAFSVEAKATELVTSGLYARIRNPIYVFGGLIIFGVIVFTGRPWFSLIFAILIPIQVYRSRKESRVLEAKFGAAYVEYKRKTWF